MPQSDQQRLEELKRQLAQTQEDVEALDRQNKSRIAAMERDARNHTPNCNQHPDNPGYLSYKGWDEYPTKK